MSKKTPSKGFQERTTMGPGVIITPPPKLKSDGLSRHYVAAKGHKITEEDALRMGRALFDSIAKERAQAARREK